MSKRYLVLLSAFLFLNACARSESYRRDQDYPNDMPKSYYSKPGSSETSTQRIESMGQPKKRVAVLAFWNDTPVRGELGPFAADELRRNLELTQRVILPLDARSTLETKDFVQGNNIKVAQLMREARRLGVAVIILGRVSRIVFRQKGDEIGVLRQTQSLAGADMELKIFDVTAGREIAAVSRSGEASANGMIAFDKNSLQNTEYRAELSQLALREAVAQATPDVIRAIEKMAWEGRIAQVLGGRIYVNAGRASGLINGDILRVMAPGDELFDPNTGAYLGRTEGSLKGTLEVRDFVGEDGSMAVIHTGSNFKVGDVVRLY